jgi:hypothetical protein
MSVKMSVFWDVVSCTMLDIDQCFRGDYGLHHQDVENLMMEVLSISKKSGIV